MKLIPTYQGSEILRGVRDVSHDLTNDLKEIITKFPRTDRIEMVNEENKTIRIFTVSDNVIIEISRRRGVGSAKPDRNPNYGKASHIVRDTMLSGKPFTREELLNKMAEELPNHDRLKLHGLMGTAMQRIADVEMLEKRFTHDPHDSRVKIYTFTKKKPVTPSPNRGRGRGENRQNA